MKKDKMSGFTLIEMIVVVVIIGIIAAAGFPALMKWVPAMKLRGDTNGVYSMLQKAKMEAIKSNTCVGVSLSGVSVPANTVGGDTVTLFRDDGGSGGTSCDGLQGTGEVTLSTYSTDERVYIDSMNIGAAAGNSLCYDSSGAVCSTQAGNIVLANNGKTTMSPLTITFRAAGSITIQ